MTPKLSILSAFEIEAFEERYQAFSKFVVDGNMIGDVGPAHLLKLFATEPGE